jgi:hypothetical protein
MRRPTPLPASLAHKAFRVDEATLVPISRGRTRRTDLTSPLWGVRSPPTTSFWQALRAPGCVIAPDEAFSHLTAARMLGLPLPQPWRPEERWHITGEEELPRMRRRQVVSHRSVDERGVVIVNGLRCTDPLTTWADLASTLAVDDLVVMGDAIVELGPAISIGDLRGVIRARARHRGVVRMREAGDLVRIGSRSPMESRTRLVFVREGLPEPELNAPVHDAAGEWLAFGDFVWRERRVVAEFDGDFHRTDRRQWQSDVARRESVQEAGWTYVQLTARSVTVPAYSDRLIRRLRRLLL